MLMNDEMSHPRFVLQVVYVVTGTAIVELTYSPPVQLQSGPTRLGKTAWGAASRSLPFPSTPAAISPTDTARTMTLCINEYMAWVIDGMSQDIVLCPHFAEILPRRHLSPTFTTLELQLVRSPPPLMPLVEEGRHR